MINKIIEKKGSLKLSKQVDITDRRQVLSERTSYILPEMMGPYGIAFQLKKYSGLDVNVILNNCSYEHGIYFSEFVCQVEVTHFVSHILTFSPYREEIIKKLTDISPVAIGPYIAYAENYHSEKYIKKMKSKLGRVLVVMPSHSTQGIDVGYDIHGFIKEIEKIKKQFDTIMVCLHIEDLRKGTWKLYKEKGYCIVSSGNIYSPCFLNRMRYILSLADAVVVNTATTGIAYAMHMNLPVRLIRQQVTYSVNHNNNAYVLEKESLFERLYELFDQKEFVQTEEQKEFGNYVFGLKKVKTRDEMRMLLSSLARKS